MAAVAERASDDRDLMHHPAAAGADRDRSDFQRDVKKLVENLLSKLNPLAEEFFPSSQSPTAASSYNRPLNSSLSADAPVYVAASEKGVEPKDCYADGLMTFGCRKARRNGYGPVKRSSEKVQNAQREDRIRRTVYISDVDQHVTEEQLAALFATCGHVLDCRVCGDPHSVLRFAFIEFADEQGARAALSLGGTVLGYYPLRVLPSKTAILPVNPTYLPQSADEKEMCARTIYCTNIDKKVTRAEVKALFEAICGKVSRLRLLGDRAHSTRIAFVEFAMAESAIIALNCSGLLVKSLPIRVSPSKTPVRPRAPRSASTNSAAST